MILFDTGKNFLGKQHSEETKQKMRDAHMKRKELKLQQETV